MIDSDLIDVQSLDLSDEQTWLYTIPNDSGQKVDIIEWNLSFDYPEDDEYVKLENDLYDILDNILKNDVLAMPDKHKFDSRTYVKPKKRVTRPSIQSIVEVTSNPPSLTSALGSGNKYLTYNKYNAPVSPMIRLKTFNLDTNTENSGPIKDYATKRRSLIQDDETQLDELSNSTLRESPDRLSDNTTSKPIVIDYSQPAHNVHSFNKGISSLISNDRGSLNMFRSGESLMRMSPPSLVSSLLMDASATFNNNMDSLQHQRDSGLPTSARESIDPMVTSMTLSILDEKDMSTSFLSQTTYPDNDSLIDSLPPSLVSSVNSSYIVSNMKHRDSTNSVEPNIFSSATFTHLEQSEKLLSARPRHQMFNSFTKRDSLRSSESYTKSREEACQIEPPKVLNENKQEPSKTLSPEMTETVTIHFSNNKFKIDADAEKENLNSTFEKDDAFYRDMGLQRPDLGKNSMNVTLDKQELNEIIQARQKLSLARKGLPNEPEKSQVTSPKVEKLSNQTITMPRQTNENASELLSKRRSLNINTPTTNGFDKDETINRDTPKRNSTFRKLSPKATAMDTTVVYVQEDKNNMIDINSATLSLIDSQEKNLGNGEWGLQEHAMVGSNESTDTGTFSSSSPPESVPDSTPAQRSSVASTPLISLRKGFQKDFIALHSTISPIYDVVDDKSYTITKVPSSNANTAADSNVAAINSATIVRKSSAKRDILAGRTSPEKRNVFGPTVSSRPTGITRVSSTNAGTNLPPPKQVPRQTSLPTSKLRQYSSHKELSRIPGGPQSALPRALSGSRTMLRRNVYASNPALSPTSSGPVRQDSYIIRKTDDKPLPEAPPPLVRQGTETLRRERPASQIVAPKDLRNTGAAPTSYSGIAVTRNQYTPSATRPVSIAGVSQLKMPRPSSASGPMYNHRIPASSEPPGQRACSALPRPSRLPAPTRHLRPPSVYSVAPATADVDHY